MPILGQILSTTAIVLAIISLGYSIITQKENLLNMRLGGRIIYGGDLAMEILGTTVTNFGFSTRVAIESANYVPQWDSGEEVLIEDSPKMYFHTTDLSKPEAGRRFEIEIESTNWVEIEKAIRGILMKDWEEKHIEP